MLHTLCPVVGDITSILTLPSNLITKSAYMHIFMHPRRFYASHSSIHITIPDFSPTNLR